MDSSLGPGGIAMMSNSGFFGGGDESRGGFVLLDDSTTNLHSRMAWPGHLGGRAGEVLTFERDPGMPHDDGSKLGIFDGCASRLAGLDECSMMMMGDLDKEPVGDCLMHSASTQDDILEAAMKSTAGALSTSAVLAGDQARSTDAAAWKLSCNNTSGYAPVPHHHQPYGTGTAPGQQQQRAASGVSYPAHQPAHKPHAPLPFAAPAAPAPSPPVRAPSQAASTPRPTAKDKKQDRPELDASPAHPSLSFPPSLSSFLAPSLSLLLSPSPSFFLPCSDNEGPKTLSTWTGEENQTFFSTLQQHGRNFDKVHEELRVRPPETPPATCAPPTAT